MSEEYYEEIRNNSRDYSDRYKNCNIIKDKETGETLLSLREMQPVPITVNDQYHKLESHEVGRLDILAHRYYKNPLLWWVIAQANNIYDPFVLLPAGTLLRIPSIESLYGTKGILL